MERLASQGHEIVAADNGSLDRLNHLRGKVKFYPVHADCRNEQQMQSLVEGMEGFHFIYHLASTVGVNRVLDDPAGCIENNIDSLRAVLSLGIPGLFTSTSEVYGRSESILREDSPLLYSSKARWSYAISKLAGEWMCQQNKGWKAVRLFNVVGPRQSNSYGAVLPRFVSQALACEPLTVHGDGKQIRTFIDVRDCAEILDRLRDKQFDVVNVGGSRISDMRHLAECVRDELESLSEIKMVPYEKAYPDGFEDCPVRIPCLDKLDSLLPERPFTNFSKTISDLAEVFQHDTVCK